MRSEIVGRDEILGTVEEILGRAEIAGWVDDGTVQHEILGREEILGRDEILGYLPALVKSGKFKRRRGKGVWGKLARSATSPLSMLSQRGIMLNGAFVGDDELALAAEGGSAERESLARRTSSGYNSKWSYLGSRFGKPRGIRGPAAKRAKELRERHGRVGAAPVVDGLPHPTPLTAEQKEDLRTYLRHLPALGKSQAADQERLVAQLREKFGEVKERARAGDARALERWNDIVKWTNKLQAGALKNDANSLMHLRNISRTGIFNPRFRVAS